MYSERLLDHFRNPRHAGVLSAPAKVVQVENPACGDILKLSARIEDGRIVEAAFLTRGCTASIAAGSALAVWLTEKSRDDLRRFHAGIIENELDGLRPESKHVAALAAAGVNELLKVWPE
jgi:nitrogen fixation NifU-like protein